jgi:hypothetical protein|nr:MAG TPA: Survival of motor neuron protein-interacting Muscular Atrophy, snRNP assembly [Caudoviricetes sp.]
MLEELMAILAHLDTKQRRKLLEYMKRLLHNDKNCLAWILAFIAANSQF